jgi:DNA topoisomerase-3
VQTPTLAMLVERERAIASFVPRDYWEVTLVADGFSARWRSGPAERLASAPLADDLVARDTASEAPIVERVTSKLTREPPPQLFDLTTLQRTANRRFGWSAQRTLELAQALYERHKVLTYPRTDSRHLSTDVAAELGGPLAALAQLPDYARFAAPLASQASGAAPPRLNRRFVDDEKVRDHHAIIPTASAPRGLDRDEARLYDLVARRFLGAFFPDAEIALTEAWLRVGPALGAPPTGAADKQVILDALPAMPDRYLARGRVRMVAGWQEVAGFGDDTRRERPGDDTRHQRPGDARHDRTDDGEEREPIGALPPLVEGQRVPATFKSTAKQTTPPPHYTEATLLAAMEGAGKALDDEQLRAAMKDTGLGTPATRAAIIETLLRRAFITRDKRALVATPTGIGLIATVESLAVASLASPELTGTWEARLAKIARREDDRAAFMADIRAYVAKIVDAIRGAAPPPPPPPGTAAPRPAPNGARGKRTGWQRPNSRRAPSKTRRTELSDRRTQPDTRRAGAAEPSERRTQPDMRHASPAVPSERRTQPDTRDASPAVPSERRTQPDTRRAKPARANAPLPSPLTCPRCSTGTLITGSRGWGCSRWREGCGFVVWFVTAGKQLTTSQLRDLVEKGKTRKADFAAGAGRLVLDRAAPGGARFEPG